MKLAFLISYLMIAFSSYAQPTVYPDKKSFDRKWLQSGKYEMMWYAERDTQKIKLGTVATEVLVSKIDVKIITRVNLQGRSTQWVDTTVAQAGTLKPIYHSSYNMNRDMVLNFASVITGFYHDKTKDTHTQISDTVGTARFFDSNLYPHLLRLLPLEAGYTATLPIYDYNPNGKIGIVNAYVEKVESGTIQDKQQKQVNVWLVTVSDELSVGDKSVSTYAIGKKDRRLWRQEIITGKRRMVMQLVE